MDSTRTLTLADFLLARIAEDERRLLRWGIRYPRAVVFEPGPNAIPIKDHLRLRRECEAKRRIVELHERGPHPLDRKANPPFTGELETPSSICEECSGWDDPYVDQVDYPCTTLKLIAAIYADHPDYRAEWRG